MTRTFYSNILPYLIVTVRESPQGLQHILTPLSEKKKCVKH